MKILKLILARGGSKGLPNKNIKMLLGKPLIEYSIMAGKKSKYGSDVYISTDSSEIARIAKSCGAKVPFLRPKNLASDKSLSSESILHAIDYLESKNKYFDYILLLEPTSPLRNYDDVNKSIDFFFSNEKAKSCVSIVKSEISHPSFLFNKKGNFLNHYSNNNSVIRRQDLSDLYYPEGSIYLCEIETYKKTHTFYMNDFTIGYELPFWKSFEIDTMEDFIIVESILKASLNNKFKKI